MPEDLKQKQDRQTCSDSQKKSLSNIILYDGVCNLCWFWVQFILKRDKNRLIHFVPLQSLTAKKIIRENDLHIAELSTIVFIDNEGAHIKSLAILRVFKKLPMPWPLLYGFILVPAFIRDNIYGFIGRRRYKWFGRGETCYLPDKKDRDMFI